jgi:uncharacterized protein
MNCPECNAQLSMGDRQGVEIDFCPQCRGIWLGRGKLDKIVERLLGSTPSSQNPMRYDEDDYHHDDHYGNRGHRRKGFWGNLFD